MVTNLCNYTSFYKTSTMAKNFLDQIKFMCICSFSVFFLALTNSYFFIVILKLWMLSKVFKPNWYLFLILSSADKGSYFQVLYVSCDSHLFLTNLSLIYNYRYLCSKFIYIYIRDNYSKPHVVRPNFTLPLC